MTSHDVTVNNTVEQQANIWAKKLEKNLKKAQLVRNTRYIWERSILALIILVVVFALDKILSLLKHDSLSKAIAKLLPGINPTHAIVKSELYCQIEKALRDRHIEIPFPQRDIHLRGNLPCRISPDLETVLLQWLKDFNKPSSN